MRSSAVIDGLIDTKDFSRAEKGLQAISMDSPSDPLLHYCLGLVREAHGRRRGSGATSARSSPSVCSARRSWRMRGRVARESPTSVAAPAS